VQRFLVWLILVAALLAGMVLYRAGQRHADITPDARHQIDRAKQR